MVRFLSVSILSLLVALGLACLPSRTGTEGSKIRTIDDYWAETELSAAPLEDLLQDQTCVSSERYFLACANAILSMANRFNLSFNTSGELVPVSKVGLIEASSEKAQLEPWKRFYYQGLEMTKISFLKAWQRLDSHYVKFHQRPMIIGMGLNGFISVFRDPHTYLVPVAQFKEVYSRADNRSTSLGLILGLSNGQYVVKKVTEGSPAKKVGLQRGDVLVSINATKVRGLFQARVSDLLRGELGQVSELVLKRDGQAFKVKLRRVEITVPTVTTQFVDGIKPVGVIGINKFAKGACAKVKDSLKMLSKAHIRGLLLDLRDNPGGQLEEAACISSLFVGPKEKIFEVRYLDSRKKSEAYYGTEEKIFDLPVAVLVNASSASASEVVAGALRDLNRAILVGERTFGKGSFQEGEIWAQNGKVALFETRGFYYLPSGRSPQMTGLEPDVLVSFDNIKLGREEDQYINPMHAPDVKVDSQARQFSYENCLEADSNESSEDLQMQTAKQAVLCLQASKKVNL